MRINSISSINTNMRNFKGIIAPQGVRRESMAQEIFGKELPVYEKLTDRKDIDVVLLSYKTQNAFIVDRNKKNPDGTNYIHKELNTSEKGKGDFAQRVKDAAYWVKADDNMVAALGIMQDPNEMAELTQDAAPLLKKITSHSGDKEIETWKDRLETI